MEKNIKMKTKIHWPENNQILKDVFQVIIVAAVIFAVFPPPWPVMLGIGFAGCIILQILYELFPEDCQHKNGFIASTDLDPRSICRDCGARVEWTKFLPKRRHHGKR